MVMVGMRVGWVVVCRVGLGVGLGVGVRVWWVVVTCWWWIEIGWRLIKHMLWGCNRGSAIGSRCGGAGGRAVCNGGRI